MSYEPQTEPKEFVGLDRSEAVAQACSFFSAAEDELQIAELGPESVSGLAARVVVVAVPRGVERPPPGPPGRREGRRDGGREGGREGREPAREGRGRRDERRDEGRGERGRRGNGRGQGRGRREEGRGRREEGREEQRERGPRQEAREEPVEAPEDIEATEAEVRGELSEVGQTVQGIMERMDLGRFGIAEAEEGDDLVVIRLDGAAATRLSGTDGRAVDALQLLANQAAMRIQEEAPRIVVEVEGDREKRESYLGQIAERAARRALKTGRSVALDAMNAKDRRVLHVALRDTRDVATMSSGEGRYRQVVVVPKGAPEYDEARRLAEAAASRDDDGDQD